jgi:3-hydroxyisobutyrate dehydrogenase-like beta-hydroxyacid dehydrogenase
VSTDEDVLPLVTGGLLDGLRPGSVVVNHGTGTPGNAARLAEICAAAGVEALDAPVSGGRAGAAARALTTMVGGREPPRNARPPSGLSPSTSSTWAARDRGRSRSCLITR